MHCHNLASLKSLASLTIFDCLDESVLMRM